MPALIPSRGVGFVLLLAIVGCGTAKVTEVTGPPDFTLSILPEDPSVPAAGSIPIVVTVVRKGGFTGPVDLTLTGEFPGMTAVVSDMQTTGNRSTALITISVAPAQQLSPHQLKVHGIGAGVGEKIVSFYLTVTASEQPGFGVFFFNTAGTVAQGGSTVVPLSMFRSHYTGPIFLAVDNLPTGVTAVFNPASPLVPPLGDASNLTLVVASNAPIGTYENLQLRASADPLSHLPDTVVQFSLTIALVAVNGVGLGSAGSH